MSFLEKQRGGVRYPKPEVVGLGLTLMLAALIGYALGGQILDPNARMLKLLVGAAIGVASFILPNRYAVGFLLVLIPFPQNTTMGSTTVLFAYLIFAFWLLKIALNYERRPILSGLEAPLLFVVLMMFLSFVKVPDDHMRWAITSFRSFISSILIFYVVLNLIRTEKDIKFVMNALILSFGMVAAVALIELWIPPLRGALHFLHVGTSTHASSAGVRVGSVFGDYELFAEYLAIFIPILMVKIVTEKLFIRQLIWGPLLGIAIMLLISTATRGAFVSFIAGTVYLVWISRRILNFQRFLPLVIIASALFYVFSIALAQFSSSQSLFERLGDTKIVHGMPDTRARVWTETWEKVVESPWIGHGPYYKSGKDEKNIRTAYPHNLFLFVSFMCGIPAAIVFYIFIFMALAKSIGAARKFCNERSDFAYIVVLLSSCLVIFIVDELKISFLRYDQTRQFTFAMFALLLGASRIAVERAKERDRLVRQAARRVGERV